MSEPDTEAYAASKGGLVALTHALAISLGPDIRVNCISPAGSSPRRRPRHPRTMRSTPPAASATPPTSPALTAWLLGPESRFVTGAEFISTAG